jgi:GT2 family glycosyltransferase
MAEVILERHLMFDSPPRTMPTWSIVVCTHDRTQLLSDCLESLLSVTKGLGEIIVVDNAPTSDATRDLVTGLPVKYVRENTQGLNRARMCGARYASGDIVIYADDDTIAEEGWIPALLTEFSGSRVGAVAGLTMPYELETDAQEMFEALGGFTRGFRRRVLDYTNVSAVQAGSVGVGANMAFRRELILSMRLFEPELDMGTRARAAGDFYAFTRVVASGYRIVYTPDAVNWHRHRRERSDMLRTISGYYVGTYAALTKCLIEDHDLQTLRLGFKMPKVFLRDLRRAITRRPDHLPVDLIAAQVKGMLGGPVAYVATRRRRRSREETGNLSSDRIVR